MSQQQAMLIITDVLNTIMFQYGSALLKNYKTKCNGLDTWNMIDFRQDYKHPFRSIIALPLKIDNITVATGILESLKY